MLKCISYVSNVSLGRNLASLAVANKKVNSTAVEISETASGIKIASIAEPTGVYKGMSRIVGVFKAGSCYEVLPEHRGITHLLRRACGLSTKQLTQINLTRHLNQMSAKLSCSTTREHLLYSIDVPTCFAQRASELLATVATQTMFFNWELKATTYRLMQHDIEALNRRHLNALTTELLHEAAFGTHPLGTGLGNSLYAPASMLSWYTEDALNSFAATNLRSTQLCLSIVGHPDGQHLLTQMANGMDFLEASSGSSSSDAKKDTVVGSAHVFVGGDIRRSNHLAASNHLMLAWNTPGLSSGDAKTHMALALASRAISGPVGRISHFSPSNESKSRFQISVAGAGVALAGGIYSPYDKVGLFGFAIAASCPLALSQRAVACVRQLKTDFTEEEITRAKALLKADLAIAGESSLATADDLAVQTLSSAGKTYLNSEQMAAALDKVTMADVNQAVKTAIKSPKAALAAVSTDAHQVPPLDQLLAA